jgi:hypothetical protein
VQQLAVSNWLSAVGCQQFAVSNCFESFSSCTVFYKVVLSLRLNPALSEQSFCVHTMYSRLTAAAAAACYNALPTPTDLVFR